jgi:hypothetical protein
MSSISLHNFAEGDHEAAYDYGAGSDQAGAGAAGAGQTEDPRSRENASAKTHSGEKADRSPINTNNRRRQEVFLYACIVLCIHTGYRYRSGLCSRIWRIRILGY